jgi:hypothetical protein
LLGHARLEFRPEAVVLGTSPMWAEILLSEQTNKRAATLASALERPLQVETRATGRAETERETA